MNHPCWRDWCSDEEEAADYIKKKLQTVASHIAGITGPEGKECACRAISKTSGKAIDKINALKKKL